MRPERGTHVFVAEHARGYALTNPIVEELPDRARLRLDVLGEFTVAHHGGRREEHLVEAWVGEREVDVPVDRPEESSAGRSFRERLVQIRSKASIRLTHDLVEEVLLRGVVPVERRRRNTHRASEGAHREPVEAVSEIELRGVGQDPFTGFRRHVNTVHKPTRGLKGCAHDILLPSK